MSTAQSQSSQPGTGTARPPASIGDRLSDVDTPALIVDMAAFERNLSFMKSWVEDHNHNNNKDDKNGRRVRLRPHAKTHKTVEIAKLQMELGGAVGVCVQKLDEAQAMIEGGVTDILLTNQVVGKRKIERLIQLLHHESSPQIDILVDDIQNVHDVGNAIIASSSSSVGKPVVGVLIEVNGGQNRCGVSSHDEGTIMSIYNAIMEYSPSHTFVFRGIHCYGGSLQHVRSSEERRECVRDGPIAEATKVVEMLELHGVDCPIVTGGGTGTFQYEAEGGIHNEIQPGSYIFMDVDYRTNEEENTMFDNALFVHTTVVSTAVRVDGHLCVVDAGTKAISLDSGPPSVTNPDVSHGLCNDDYCWDGGTSSISYESGGDEHGILVVRTNKKNEDDDPKEVEEEGAGGKQQPPSSVRSRWNVGDTLRLIPGHIDPTVNMHDWLVCVREADDEDGGGEPIVCNVWRIGGRSPGL